MNVRGTSINRGPDLAELEVNKEDRYSQSERSYKETGTRISRGQKKDRYSYIERSEADTLSREAIIKRKTGTRTSRGRNIKPIKIID